MKRYPLLVFKKKKDNRIPSLGTPHVYMLTKDELQKVFKKKA